MLKEGLDFALSFQELTQVVPDRSGLVSTSASARMGSPLERASACVRVGALRLVSDSLEAEVGQSPRPGVPLVGMLSHVCWEGTWKPQCGTFPGLCPTCLSALGAKRENTGQTPSRAVCI